MSEIELRRGSTTPFQVIGLPLGALAGLLLGLVVPDIMIGVEFLGRIFLGLMTLFVIPVIVTGAISGIAGLGRLSRLGVPLGRVVLFFVVTTVVGVLLGGLSGWLLAPGAGLGETLAMTVVAPVNPATTTLTAVLSGAIGGIVLQMASSETYLGLVLLALALGVTLTSMGNAGRSAMSFFRAVNDALMRLTGLLMYAAPVGVFFLVAGAVARQASVNSHWLALLGGLTVAVFAALVIQGVVVLPLAMTLTGGRSPVELLKGTGPALLTAFGLGSSAATLPVTYRSAVGSGQVEPQAAAVALPLGMVINRSGTAVYMMVAALFMTQLFGVEVSLAGILLLGLVSLGMALFAAATPMTTLITMPVVLNTLGVDPAQAALGAGVIAAGDWLLIRLATVVNVWGDCVGGALLTAAPAAKVGRSAAERRPLRQAPDREPRPPRERVPHESRDGRERGRGRRDSRSIERRPKLPVVSPQSAAGRPAGGRVVRDEESPFSIRTSDRPVLESTPHDESAPTPRFSEPKPPAPERERRQDSHGGRPPRPGQEYNRTRAGRRGPRPQPASDESRPTPPERTEPTESTSPGRMSQTKVARELTRVTEHLRRIEAGTARPVEELKPSDQTPTPPPVEPISEREETTAAEVYARQGAEDRELEFDLKPEPEREPEPDSEPEPEPERESESEPEDEPDAADDLDEDVSEPDDDESTEFGRSRRFKDPKRRGEEVSAESREPASEPTVQESFSSEQVSFGRAKRKKNRH